MNHPLWLINSSLLGTLMLTAAFIFFSVPRIPSRTKLVPQDIKTTKKVTQKVDIAKIYTNDLFGTYQEPPPTHTEQKIDSMPKPPVPQPVKVPLAPAPRFLEPIQIALKGIIIVSGQDQDIAIIEDSKTKVTKNYRVGDKIEDAQLVRIMRNKIALIRSNGQQETIYISQYDAELDQLVNLRTEWNTIVQPAGDSNYLVDPKTFIEQINSLAQLIDVFNLTTVYQKGQSIGCRIGIVSQKSLVRAMGLEPGDIIMSINNIPANNTENRYKIYEHIISLQQTNTIVVSVKRQQEMLSLTYQLKNFNDMANKQTEGIKQTKSAAEMIAEQEKILKEREKLAPTIYDLAKQEKRDLIYQGKRRNRNTLSNTGK